MAHEVALSGVPLFAQLRKGDLTRLGRSITEREYKDYLYRVFARARLEVRP